MKKGILALTMAALCLGGTVNAYASTNNNAGEIQKVEIASPRYDASMTGTEYVKKTTSKYNKVYWSHVASNLGGGTDSITYKVTRTKNTSLNSSANVTVNGVVSQAGVKFEVGVGKSQSVSTNCTFSIPYGKYELQFGSRMVKTTGTEKKWFNGKVTSSKTINGNWSYQSYSNKVKK